MLKEKIAEELKEALRTGAELRLSVFRMLSAAVHNREIEKRTRSGVASDATLTEEEIVQVIRSEVKKRRDAIEAYTKGGRPAAAEREAEEAAILGTLLPQELSDEELTALVAEGIATLHPTSARDFGTVMGWVMGRAKGRASGNRVAALIKERLAGL